MDESLLEEAARSAGEAFADEFANANPLPFRHVDLLKVGSALIDACEDQFGRRLGVAREGEVQRLRDIATRAFVDRIAGIEAANARAPRRA